MTNKKTLIIDCDGVLYPSSQIPLREFVEAMKETYRQDLHLSGEVQRKVSEKTIARKRLGMYNYIKSMCAETGFGFETFCQKMQSKINYDNIERDDTLLQLMLSASRQDEVVILTNNTYSHLNQVLQKRFGKTIFEIEALGISCYDIVSTEKNGVFYPKQDPKGLELFIERIGRTAEQCILVDDSKRNIEAAEKIGMQGVLINENRSLKSYLNDTYHINFNEKSGREHG